MHRLISTVSVALLLTVLTAGCSANHQPSQPSVSISPPSMSPTAADDGLAAMLAELPAAPLDAEGRPAGDAVLELIAAHNAADWEKAYSLYGHPEADFEMIAREWVETAGRYRDFTVHEARAVDEDTALVRVTYAGEATLPDGVRHEYVIAEPGEWWAVEMVDGLWKVQWLPRQW
jgi:hypothetical protein